MKAPNRKTDHPIHPLIANRWSARAMSGEPISDEEIASLFEAARWAPSSYNNQPWRFLYGKRDSASWDLFFDLLVPFNKSWCTNAAVLGLSLARKNFFHNDKPSRTHAYDTGAAWGLLSIEGCSRDLIVHGMEGFNYDQARVSLNIPNEYEILAMFAIGRPGKKENLPKELQEKEAPGQRRAIEQFAFEGIFRG
jgi:nitroreductase